MKNVWSVILLLPCPVFPVFADGNPNLGAVVQIMSGGKIMATMQLPKGTLILNCGHLEVLPATQSEPRRVHLSGTVRLEVQRSGQSHVIQGQMQQQLATIEAEEVIVTPPSLSADSVTAKPVAR